MTQVVNDLVNGAGMTFFHRLSEETVGHRGRAGAGELRGPRDLRVPGADRRGRLLRQQDRRRRADPDAAGDAHPGRARVALADQQPAPADGQRGHRRLLRRRGPAGRVRAARAARRPGGRSVRAAPGRAAGARAFPRTSRSGWRSCRRPTRRSNIVETAKRDERRPDRGGPGALRARASGSGSPTLVARILALPRDDRWQTMARAALRDDLHAVHAQLTAQVLADDRRRTSRCRCGSRTGRRTTPWWSAAPSAPSTRSAPTTTPTWPGCRSGCAWCGRCCRRP